ncbi:MAG: glycosyltransferase family 4 protein [Bacteroidetes bacterium]|nr:glycosyltransferase family 4 protein [Bacteroidota bacterium]
MKSKKKSILFATGSFFPDPSGGPNITMYWLSKAFVKNGLAVHVLTTDRGVSDNMPKNTWLNLEYGYCQYVRTNYNNLPFLLIMKSIKSLFGKNTLYLSSFFYPLSFILAPIALLLGIKVIWAPRGETSPDALKFSSHRKKIVLQLIRTIRKYIIFHATSTAEVKNIRDILGPCRIEYIPVGMEIPNQIESSKPNKDLLFLGRIHPIKGLENLINALNLSTKFRSSPHRMLIAGYAQQNHDEILKKLIHSLELNEKVVFLGKVEGAEKNRTLACSYALVLPSFSENFGAVVAEALAQGTPVIASLGTPWSILEEEKAGYHIANDPESLASAIDTILSLSEEQYQVMRKNARKLAVEHLSVDHQVPIWQALISQ